MITGQKECRNSSEVAELVVRSFLWVLKQVRVEGGSMVTDKAQINEPIGITSSQTK